MKIKYWILLLFYFIWTAAQASNSIFMERDTILPKVFIIGHYENLYENLLLDYETLLLTACDEDMGSAFKKWTGFLKEMTVYSEEVNYNLKGVKLWINVFFNADGKVDYLAYYLKPISKNLDRTELNQFLESFIKRYRFPLQHHERYSHHGTATFPLFSELYEGE